MVQTSLEHSLSQVKATHWGRTIDGWIADGVDVKKSHVSGWIQRLRQNPNMHSCSSGHSLFYHYLFIVEIVFIAFLKFNTFFLRLIFFFLLLPHFVSVESFWFGHRCDSVWLCGDVIGLV